VKGLDLKRNGRKRLNVDIPEVLYNAIRKRAHEHYCTMTKFVMKVMIKELKQNGGSYTEDTNE